MGEVDGYMYNVGYCPRFYVFRYKRVEYIILDLEGKTSKSELLEIINRNVGVGLEKAKETNSIYNPYRDIDRAMLEIERKYNVVALKNPIDLTLDDSLKNAIKNYNMRILQEINNRI